MADIGFRERHPPQAPAGSPPSRGRILRERKRREFDPALEAVHRLVEAPGATGAVHGRLAQMADLLATMDGVASRFLEDPESSRGALAFFARAPFGRGRKKRR